MGVDRVYVLQNGVTRVIGKIIMGVMIGTLLSLLFGAFVFWDIAWILDISSYEPVQRYFLIIGYFTVLFFSVLATNEIVDHHRFKPRN